MVFDKTGTLTYAVPTVQDVVPFGGHDAQEMLRLAACLEEHYPHSMATAVVEEAKRRGLSHEEYHSQVQYIVAHGISSRLHGKKVLVGSYHFLFEDEGILLTEEQRQTIIQKYKQAEDDFYSKTILAAEVKEEDFFCHVTHKTWDLSLIHI